tara:strand:- start:83 stop:1003 length:921 start_codon:yes stop_codon:yes gene_type:complete
MEKKTKKSKKYECKLCNFKSNKRCNYVSHLKTQKHIKNHKLKNNNIKSKNFLCECGKKYKYNSGLWRHKKKCNITNKLQKMENEINDLKNENKIMKHNTNEILEVIKQSSCNNTDLINEVKKLKECKNQIITQNIQNQTNNQNNTQNISINVFLNEHCKNAMNLTDFIEKLQVTFEDISYTGKTNYVEGISRILINNLNKMNKLERPIHCSDVKRKVLYIKNEEGWEKDKQHEKITKCIKNVEYKQIKKIPEWTKNENIDIYKSDNKGMKYQKVIFNSMGGMNQTKREKNKKNIIKNLSEKTDFKN